jgi:hypothetical protein
MTNTMTNAKEHTMTSVQDNKSVAVRSLLWVVLVVTLVANGTTSVMGLSPFISVGFGVVTLASGVALVAHYRRR